MRLNRLPLLCLTALVVLLTAFYWPWLSGKASFYFEDSCNAFEPFCTLIGKSLAHGHLPMWDRYDYCGMSQIALPSPPLLYPPNMIFALAPYNQGVSLMMVLSSAIAAVGTYLLIGSLGWGILPAMLGAVVVSCSGYMFTFVNNYSIIATAAWLPMCLLCLRKSELVLDETAARRWAIGLAACIAMMITAGRPEISGASLVLIVGYAVCLKIMGWYQGGGTAVWNSAAFKGLFQGRSALQVKAIAIGLLLAMPTIVPAMEWLPWSRRAAGLTPAEVLQFSASWYDLLGLYVSQPLGDLQVNAHHFRALIQPKNFPPYFGSAFVSSLTILMASIGVQRRGRLVYACSLLVLLGACVVSLGSNMPLMSELVTAVPSLSAIRFPSKLTYFAVVPIALFAARGLFAYLSGKAKFVAPLIVALAFAGFGALLLSTPNTLLPFLVNPPNIAGQAQQAIGQSLLVWSVIGLLGLGVLILGERMKKRPHAAAAFSLAVLFSLLTHAALNNRHAAPGNFFAEPSSVADKIKQMDPSIANGSALTFRTMPLILENLTVPPSFLPEEPLAHAVGIYRYQRQMLKPFGNIDFGIATPWGFDGPTTGDYSNFLLNAYVKSTQSTANILANSAGDDSPLCRLFQITSTKYVVVQMYRSVPSRGGMTRIYVPLLNPNRFDNLAYDNKLNARIYRFKYPLPRAFLSYDWSTAPRDAVLTRLFSEAPTNAGAKSDPPPPVLLEGDQTSVNGSETPTPIPLTVTEQDAETIDIEATADKPAVLVLCDQFYPGWNATVDGKPVEIIRCNGFFRAVNLQPGSHKVRFEYRPKSLLMGALLALLGLVWAVIIAVGDRRFARNMS